MESANETLESMLEDNPKTCFDENNEKARKSKFINAIPTFSEYIKNYILNSKKAQKPSPGEHHFVSAYLLPRLFQITGKTPDYINPDGTKGIVGDVVYYEDNEHQFGIEVKFETVRLTKNEFNSWVLTENNELCPHTFIGLGTEGIIICPWDKFRDSYLKLVKKGNENWQPKPLTKGYGPQKSVNVLIENFEEQYICRYQSHMQLAQDSEQRFIKLLAKEWNNQ